MLKNKRIIASVLLMILFCFVAIFVKTKNNLVIDEKIYNIISILHTDIATVFFKSITYIGNIKFTSCFCVLLLLIKSTKNKIGVPITITVVISGIINIVLKNIFERQRPLLEQLVYEDSFSFPSGHSMVTAAIYSMIIYLSCKYIKSKKIEYTVNIISGMVIFLVGISRIYLRVHYFSDVFAGWCLGVIITLIYSVVIEKMSKVNGLEGV